jgi:hypothetical protein
VISSGEALVVHLTKSILPGATLYVIGEEGLVQLLSRQGFIMGEEHARAVIVSLDRELTYEKLRRGSRLVQRGAELIATNPDPAIPAQDGLEPGAGAILAAVEAATGVKARSPGNRTRWSTVWRWNVWEHLPGHARDWRPPGDGYCRRPKPRVQNCPGAVGGHI